MLAASRGHKKNVEILLTVGIGLDIQDSAGNTALFHAVRENHTDVIEILLTAGCKVDVLNNDGETALMDAVL